MDKLAQIMPALMQNGFYILNIPVFYYSVKKCFMKGRRGTVGSFLMIALTNPLICMYEAILLATALLNLFASGFVDNINGRDLSSMGYVVIYGGAVIGFYFALIVLYAYLIGWRLKIKDKSLLLFLYLIFSTVTITISYSGSSTFVSDPDLELILETFIDLLYLTAFWLLCRLDVAALSEITEKNLNTRRRTFIVPPTVYTSLYIILGIAIKDVAFDGYLGVALVVFTNIILYLLIWAFFSIIKNISNACEIKTLSVEVMEALAHTIDAKDEYTRGHSVRVAKYSRMLAEKMNLPEKECENVYYMGLLHDIGKIGVPNSIINSKNELTEEEYSVIKTHPGLGFDILAEIKSRPDLVIGAKWHHERFDGKGYPDGKAGEEIPLPARIIAVADSYDAMTSNRSYRSFLPQDKVRSEIKENSGSQFDPAIAECMLAIIDEDKDYKLHE